MLRNTLSDKSNSFVGEYRLIRLLGSGTFSQVFEAISPNNERYALKITPKLGKKSEEIHDAEIEALLRLRGHPNVVKLIDVFETDTDWVLVLEFIDGCDLFRYLRKRRRLSPAQAFQILKPISSLLAESHSKHSLCHRDLKLENVMIETGTERPILIDFGLAVRYESLLRTRCGSEEYAAPEIIIGKPYHGERVDVWSFGVIMFACIYGCLPFYKIDNIPVNSYDSRSLFNQILFAPIALCDLDAGTESLLKSVLDRQDYKRPSFKDLEAILSSFLIK